MSGAEALAVLSAISTVISIVDGIKKVYDAASDAKGLPSAFREVANRVPLVRETLRATHQEIHAGDVNDVTCKAMQNVVEACGVKAENLEAIFKKVLPEPDASRTDRYLKALKSLPKGSRVELLMKGMLEDIQVLASSHGMKTVTKDELEKLTKAINELGNLPPSADEDSVGGKTQSATHNAEGNIYQAMGDQNIATDSSRLYRAENMTFSDANMRKALFYVQSLNLYTDSVLDNSEFKLACEQGRISLEEVKRHDSLLTRVEEACLQSLAFSRLGYRQRSIRRALRGTCTWLPENARYKAWTNRDDIEKHFGLLWVKGGVGTGKSTLVNEAYLAAQEWPTKNNKHIIAGYFAHRGGEPMERSREGLVRTLLLQVLPKHKIMLDDLVSIYNTRRSQQGTGWQWTSEELFAFMGKHLVKSGGTAFYFFIDGLDELAEDEARVLVSDFRKLTMTASATGANINVCLSSRYYPNISTELCPEIMVEAGNEHDIRLFVNEHLFIGRPVDIPTRDAYANEIVQTASGAFLWAILAVGQLNKDHDKGRSASVMKSRLATNPRELDEMYTEIFKDVEEEDRADVLQFWRCVVFAARPLKLTEFNHLFAFSSNPPPASLVEWLRAGGSECTDGDRLVRMATELSRGLVTVRLKQPTFKRAETDSTAPVEVSGRFRLSPAEFTNATGAPAEDIKVAMDNEAATAEQVEGQPDQQQDPQNYGQALLAALFNMIDWDQAINFHADLEVDAEALESGLDSLWRMFLEAGYEIVPPDETDGNNWYLEFMHTSVQEFFLDGNAFSLIQPETKGMNSSGQGHYFIAKACFAYIKMKEMEPLAGLAEGYLTEMNFPKPDQLINSQSFALAGYAFRFFCHHARLCEEEGMSLDFLLSSALPRAMIITGKWDYLPGRPVKEGHHRIRTDCSDYGTAQVSRLRFLCGSGLFYTAEQFIKSLEGAKEVNVRDRLGKTPLYYLFERARLFKSDQQMADFARFLLQCGADPNVGPDQWYDTLLELTLQKHLDKSAECVIDGGASINPKNSRKGPLTVLVTRKPEDLDRVKWLLSKGARPVTHAPLWARFLLPGLFGGLGGCALEEAVRVSSPRMVEMLFGYVKTRDLDAKDAEELVREALDKKRYSNLGVVLASRQVRRVVNKEIVSLVQETLRGLGQRQSHDGSGSRDNGRVCEESEIKRITELVEDLGKNAVHGRFVSAMRKGCCWL